MWGRRCIGIALLGAGVSSCTNGVLIHSEVAHASGVRSHLVTAVTTSAIQTRIQNNPFPSSKDVLNLTVTRAMGGRHQDVVTTFAYEPASDERGLYTLIIRFEPPRSLSGAELCQGDEGPGADSVAGKVRLLAAFCLGDDVLSEVKGEVGGVESVDNPAFKLLIQQTLLALFPPDERDLPDTA